MKPELTDESLQKAFKSADWETAERDEGGGTTPFRNRSASPRAADAAPVRRSRQCPEPERLWDAARGNLAPRQMRKIVDHVSTCPTCAFDFNAARKTAEELGEFIPPRSGWAWKVEHLRRMGGKLWRSIRPLTQTLSVARSWLRDPWLPKSSTLSAAFGVLTLILICLHVGLSFEPGRIHQPASDRPDTLAYETSIRGPSEAAASWPSEIRVPEHEAMPRDQFILEWEAIPGARYDLVLMTPDLEEVAAFYDVEFHRLQIPGAYLEKISDESELLWRVRAYLNKGEQRESKIQSVRLKPAQPVKSDQPVESTRP